MQATREHLRGDLNARLEDNLTRAAAAVEAWRNERHTARPLDALERAELRALLDRERSTQTRLQLADAGGSIIATSTHPVEPVPIRVPPAALHGDGMGEYAGSDGTRLAVRARALAHGWWLVADEPVALAFAPVTPVSVRIFTVDLALLLQHLQKYTIATAKVQNPGSRFDPPLYMSEVQTHQRSAPTRCI